MVQDLDSNEVEPSA